MRAKQHAALVILVALLSSIARARWSFPEPTPVNRIVENLIAHLEEHPNDAKTWYALGRAHSLAFASGIDQIGAYKGDVLPWSVPKDTSNPTPGPNGNVAWFLREEDGGASRLSEEERVGHLEQAITCFEKAIKIGLSDTSSYLGMPALHLSYAYVLDQGVDMALQIGFVPGVEMDVILDEDAREELEQKLMEWEYSTQTLNDTTRAFMATPGVLPLLLEWSQTEDDRGTAAGNVVILWWKESASSEYLEAYDCSYSKDRRSKIGIGTHRNLVSHEAGSGYMRLVINRGATREDRDTIERVNRGLKKLEGKSSGNTVTPIIFPLDEDRSLGSLLAPSTTVTFDLDGTGRDHSWPWVQPDTGILVWDPDNTGKITSGRQLFGSVTWWLMFDNGYRALDALDDDRDGRLTGDELEGIAVWLDANSNGVSDPGEVKPVAHHHIAALSTRATTIEDGCPANHAGVRFTDGRSLPTYDWITASVETKP